MDSAIANASPTASDVDARSAEPRDDPSDFSTVVGGPLYSVYQRLRIVSPPLELAGRRIVVVSLIAWLPLLLLAIIDHRAWGNAKIPFLYDIDVHVRFLISLPLLIYAELVVHQRVRGLVGQFPARNIIRAEDRSRFEVIRASSIRMRNSKFIELAILAFVFLVGPMLWRKQMALQGVTWYTGISNGVQHLTFPGWYMALVSVPMFQFILLRWYFRLFVWGQFLWRVTRLNLRLIPTHPDRAAGLGFLPGSAFALAPVLVAHSALLAGMIANRIFYEGAKLPMFKVEIIVVVAFLLILALGPLTVFAPRLMAARRNGMREYGQFASRYVDEFDQKWLRGQAPQGEALVGSADLQSLADLGNSFEVIREMQPFPFGRQMVIRLIIMILLPLAPLILTMIPLDELLNRLVQTIL